MTTSDDDLRSQLHGAADSIDPGDLSLEEIRATARRRGRMSRAGAVVGVLGLVSAGVVAFMVTDGSDDPGTLRSADPSTPDSTMTTESTVAVDDAVVTTLPEPSTPSVTVEVVQRPGMIGQPAGVGGAPDYSEWSVPWGDGFLVGTQAFPPQLLPDELPDEVAALFPPEVVELFAGELPPTIAEATEMLSEAGLLDVVADIIAENPEAYDAIYSVPPESDGPTLDVRFTTDGVTWEPIEMTAPPGATYFGGVEAVGDRLAVAYATTDPMTGMNPDGVVRVASTLDLVNWDVQEVAMTPPAVAFPEGAGWSTEVAEFSANEAGWALGVYSGLNINFDVLLPEDVRAELANGRGYGISSDESGITLERTSEDDTLETDRYTWDELGVEPEVAAYLSGPAYEPGQWVSAWGATPTPGGADLGSGELVATDAGFLSVGSDARFSPDGITWTAVELPVEEAFVSGAFAVDGGIVLLVSEYGGATQVYRVDATGGSPVPLDLPGLPEFLQSGVVSPTRRAVVLDASEPPLPPPPLVVEHEGFRLTLDYEDFGVEIVEVATGEIVGEANFQDRGQEVPGNVVFDEAGTTVTDPATGEVLVAIPTAVLAAADDDLNSEFVHEYRPDQWLLASRDGERFLLVDLDDGLDGEYGSGALASSGSKVLVQIDEKWAVYDLP